MSELGKMIKDRRLVEYLKLTVISSMLFSVEKHISDNRGRKSKFMQQFEKKLRDLSHEVFAEKWKMEHRIFHFTDW